MKILPNDSARPLQLGREIRREFPIFASQEALRKGMPLAYLDTAASAQKPNVVIQRINHFLSQEHSNIHRGAYQLSAAATEAYDRARSRVAGYLGAVSERSIVFTRGTTESINLVARSLESAFSPGDVILLSLLEHHSNIVPWQLLAQRRGLRIVWADITANAELDRESFSKLLKEHRPRLVSLTAHANSFGTVLPLAELLAEAKAGGAWTLVDAAQAVVHARPCVKDLGCDFLAFSGHKLYGPTGVGVLYVREEMYSLMQPFQGGGDMIASVSTEGSQWAEPPQRFEAGTPAIAEVLGLESALDFVESIGISAIESHEKRLFSHAWDVLSREPGVMVYGPARSGGPQASIISFTVDGVHPHDLATIADSFNVQIRAGHHCAMPALKRLGIPSSARASFGLYSCEEDVAQLVEAIRKAKTVLA